MLPPVEVLLAPEVVPVPLPEPKPVVGLALLALDPILDAELVAGALPLVAALVEGNPVASEVVPVPIPELELLVGIAPPEPDAELDTELFAGVVPELPLVAALVEGDPVPPRVVPVPIPEPKPEVGPSLPVPDPVLGTELVADVLPPVVMPVEGDPGLEVPLEPIPSIGAVTDESSVPDPETDGP